MKNDTTFVRMRSGDHLWDTKMSKKSTSLRRIRFQTNKKNKQHVLRVYRPILQLPEYLKLAFQLKRQYLNNYKHYHHDTHTVEKVFNWPTDDDAERQNVLPNIVFCHQQSILECLTLSQS